VLLRFAARCEPALPTIAGRYARQWRRRAAALARAQGAAEKWVMAVVAGGLDEDAAHMGVAGLGDGTEGVAPGVMWQQDRSQWPDQRIKVPVLAVYAGMRPLASEAAVKRFILRPSTTRIRRPTISS
jgi:hypothetical protein